MGDVVVQFEERYEVLEEPGPFVVYEVDEGGAVLTTAYFETYDEAMEQADALAGDDGEVRDDAKAAVAAETKAKAEEEKAAAKTTTAKETK